MRADISVIMSVYNGEEYLKEAIESIINQTFENWELVVIDDCSTDSTGEILREMAEKDERIKVHTNETNLKLPTSLNKAISLCEGKYIARMDADDIALPQRLEKQYEFMENNKDTALSSCRFLTLKNGKYASGGVGGRCDSEALRAMLLVMNPILHPGVIMRAEVIKSMDYDTSLTCTEDLQLWTRMVMENKKMQILPECLLIYRLHDKQITSTTYEKQKEEVLGIEQVYYNFLARRMKDDVAAFFIGGVYFKEDADIDKFLDYAKWLRRVTKRYFDKNAVNYALFEILAEYRRKGIPQEDIKKFIKTFSPLFVLKEIIRRKRAAKREIANCVEVANSLGLKQIPGTEEYPIFEK